MGVVERDLTRDWLLGLRTGLGAAQMRMGTWAHPIAGAWSHLVRGTALRVVPATPLIAAALVPLVFGVGREVRRSSAREGLLLPYLLLVIALGTFAPGVSFDYNLIFLPIAVVALWRPGDPRMLQGLLALHLVWWQPFRLVGPKANPLQGSPVEILMLVSVARAAGVVAAVWMLVRRARAWAGDPTMSASDPGVAQ